jgi:hypothetical protein
MKPYFAIILGSLILLLGCGKDKIISESPADLSLKESLKRIDERKSTLKELESNLQILKKFYGITFKYNPGAPVEISGDFSGLFEMRFDPKKLLKTKEEDLLGSLSVFLGKVGWLSTSFIKEGGLATPGFEGKENFYKAISSSSAVSWETKQDVENREKVIAQWLEATRNFYHACEDKTDRSQHALVSIIRQRKQMDEAGCLPLFESFKKDPKTMEIKIGPEHKGAINLVALRGIPLESLSITGENPDAKIVLNLEGLEKTKSLKELTLKNALVENLEAISQLEEMHTLVIDYPGLKRHLKSCPVDSPNIPLQNFCRDLGF